MIFIPTHSTPLDYSKLLNLHLTSTASTTLSGGMIDYRLEISNSSSLILENILLKVPLKEDIDVSHSSVKLNGTPLPEQVLQLGILIEFIAPTETSILTFSLSSTLISLEPLCIQAIALYKYTDPMYHSLKTQVVYSNEASFFAIKTNLISSLSAAEKSVTLNDIIHYTLQLTNNGTCPLNHLIYIHKLYNTAYELSESIYLDKVPLPGNLSDGIYLPILYPQQTYILSYDVCISSGTCSYYLEDHAKVILNNLLNPEVYILDTPKIKLNIYSFKTIQFERILTLSKHYPNIGELDSLSCDIIIEDYYTIPSIPSRSIEGQSLTLYQAIVYGYLSVSVQYVSTPLNLAIYSAYFKLPFSTSIVLPSTYLNEPLHFVSTLEFSDMHHHSPYTFHFLASFSIHAQCIH